MSTLKDVLGREAERSNLRNVSVCVLLVVGVVAVAFGLVELKPAIESTTNGNPSPGLATGSAGIF